MTKTFSRLLAASALALVAAPAMAQDAPATAPMPKQPMTELDLITLKRVGAPAASPDGMWAAWQETETDAETGKRNSGIWMARLPRGRAPAGEPISVSDYPGVNETTPAFSADGKRLYFLSTQSGKSQLWYLAVTADGPSGDPVQASDTMAEVAGFRLSPKGNAIAIWGDIGRNCPTFGCEDDGDRSNNVAGIDRAGDASPNNEAAGSGRTYNHLFVRHWDHWETPGNFSRIFAFSLGADGKLSGNGVALDGDPVTGLTGDAPNKPFGGAEDVAWAPDGSAVVYAARQANKDEPLSTNLDLWMARPDGGSLMNITASNLATDNLPAPSPDGKWLAWAAMARAGYEADRQVVHLLNINTGEKRALTEGWDRSVGSIAWTADSSAIIVTAQDTLQHPAYQVNITTGEVGRLNMAPRQQEDGTITEVVPLAGGGMIYLRNSIAAPNEVYHRAPNGRVSPVTTANADHLARLDGITYRRLQFAGANGDRVWAQIITPASTPPGTKLPTLLLVHGGPQGSFADGWSWRWNPRVMAAQGYGVVTIDFHGSTGYGQAFTDSINQDWGGKPLEDLKLGMEAVAAQYPDLDTANACALGASYGGYMTNWIAGNWPDRFKCLVTHAGIFDLRAMAFETEELWFDEWDHGGPWWSRPNAERWNPVNHVTSWKTPTLVIHGEKDFRIPYSQSLAAFTALQRQGITSQLLIFPDENHWILKAKNSVQWHQTVFGWVDRWLKPSTSAAR